MTREAFAHLGRARRDGPWTLLLRRALAMGVTPEAFWRLSWREWRMLTDAPAQAAMERADFNALMAQFPDDR